MSSGRCHDPGRPTGVWTRDITSDLKKSESSAARSTLNRAALPCVSTSCLRIVSGLDRVW